ncbi:MAG: hypothetical protein M1826_001426 [Phylliscum demangeonii]|nr:MAG: hypothetical protein M1826_001426 [Phylliscum demangeonii]
MSIEATFMEQMGLLSLEQDGGHPSTQTRRHEELKMTPLFSPAVSNAVRLDPNEQDTNNAAHDAVFPQYGLLSGVLSWLSAPGSGDSTRLETERLRDPRIFLNVNTPWSAFICGSQGSGKSHTLSCMLENCLLPSGKLGRLPKPLTGLVFHYDPFNTYNLGQICEAAYLCSAGIPVRVLVSPSNVWNMKRAYEKIPGLPPKALRPVVQPLLLQERDLSIDRMMRLMAVSTDDGPAPLYIVSICKILREMAKEARGAPGLNYQLFKQKLRDGGFSDKQTDPLKLRLEILESFMDIDPQTHQVRRSQQNLWKAAPGSLTIVDLSCPFVDKDNACLLFDICLALFLEQPGGTGRVVALDEAHKFMTTGAAADTFTDNLLSVIRLQRHLATRVIISTQEPTISPSLLELSSMTIVHRFTSPQWFSTLRSHLAGIGDTGATAISNASNASNATDDQTPIKGPPRDVTSIFNTIVTLNVGEALLFSPSAMLAVDRGIVQKLGMAYLKVRMRSRLSADGGRSLLAS